MVHKTANPTWITIQRLLKMSGRQQVWLSLAVLLDILLVALVVFNSALIRSMFDIVLSKQVDAFWLYAWIMLGLTIPSTAFSYLRTWSIGLFSEKTLAKLREKIAAQSRALPINYLEERHSGDLLSLLNADLGKIKTLLANNLLDLIGQLARGIGAFAYIFSINWALTLVSTLLTPAIFILINALTQPVAKRSEEMQNEIGQVNSIAQDALAGGMVVKSFNLADILDHRFHQANLQVIKKGYGIARLWAVINGIGFGLAITPFIIAFGFGGYLVIDGQMTFGSLFAFINLLNFVVNPLGSVPGIIASMSEAAGAAQRIFQVLDQPGERQDGVLIKVEPIQALAAPPAIEFKNVSFSYQDDAPILKTVNLVAPRGQTVAIVGPSGSGKSTILKLILGYYPLTDGEICLAGENLNHWQLEAARAQMAFVAQDTYLFPVSIGENIRCGKLTASQAEIEWAARQANIHDFIVSLPAGYETGVGEWGTRLSGGQKQRIALARAILKNAPILLLDEPTSALDAESEALIQEALERFTNERTCIVVAHRISTIKHASRVIVLQDGQVVEEGSHEELLARGGVYLGLYQQQFVEAAGATDAARREA